MTKPIVLRIRSGNLGSGFDIDIEYTERGHHHKIDKKLPGDAELEQIYRNWQESYDRFTRALRSRDSVRTSADEIPPSPPSPPISQAQLRLIQIRLSKATQDLRVALTKWFDKAEFEILEKEIQRISETNSSRRGADQSVRLLLRTTNPDLQKLPWHLWGLVETLTLQGEPNSRGNNPIPFIPFSQLPKILVVRGSDEKTTESGKPLELQKDLDILEQSGCNVCDLLKPNREKLINELQKKRWDVLVFAGHSFSKQFDLGADEVPVFPDELKSHIKRAIKKGLKLAIFNSCDGLGIADQLLKMGMPFVIVMRRSILDEVAHGFLEKFGEEFFKKRKNIHVVMHQVCADLSVYEGKCPSASWLPILCQNSRVRGTLKLPYLPGQVLWLRRSILNFNRWLEDSYNHMAVTEFIGGVLGLIFWSFVIGAAIWAYIHFQPPILEILSWMISNPWTIIGGISTFIFIINMIVNFIKRLRW